MSTSRIWLKNETRTCGTIGENHGSAKTVKGEIWKSTQRRNGILTEGRSDFSYMERQDSSLRGDNCSWLLHNIYRKGRQEDRTLHNQAHLNIKVWLNTWKGLINLISVWQTSISSRKLGNGIRKWVSIWVIVIYTIQLYFIIALMHRVKWLTSNFC